MGGNSGSISGLMTDSGTSNVLKMLGFGRKKSARGHLKDTTMGLGISKVPKIWGFRRKIEPRVLWQVLGWG